MTKHEEGTCATCKYFRDVDGLIGQCHRYAPRPGFYQQVVAPATSTVDAMNTCQAVWPEVDGDDGCGEWERER